MTDVDVHTGSPATTGTPERSDGRAGDIAARSACAIAFGGVVIVAAATAGHVWFAPFVAGIALGAVTGLRRAGARMAVLTAVVAALGGWGVPLLWRAIEGQPVVATGRVTAALAGLPASGWLIIAVALLIAAGQGLLGVWWARAVTGLIVARHDGEDAGIDTDTGAEPDAVG